MNVDIFVCIHFCGFLKMGKLACIKNCVFTITASLGFYKSYSHIFLRIFKKRELCENMYNAKISTFTVGIMTPATIGLYS